MTDNERLPTGSLTLADGTGMSLRDLTGRPVVLFFYPKADTPGCTTEANDFSALTPEFDAAGATVIGVSKDAPAKLARFAAKHGLNIVLASDADGDLIDRMGLWAEKAMYGRTYMGTERATFLYGADGRLVRSWRAVRVKGHADDVLAEVRAL